MRKIVLFLIIVLSMLSLTSCSKTKSFSEVVNNLGEDITVTLTNYQTEEEYKVNSKFNKIILELLSSIEYEEQSVKQVKTDRVIGLYTLNIKGNISLSLNESYFIIDENLTEIKNNNDVALLINKVKDEVIKSKYLILDSDKYNIYTSLDELKTSDISYDENVYNESYFKQNILVTVEFDYNDTESNIKCVKAYSIASLIYLDFTIDSPTPYTFNSEKKTVTVIVEVKKPSSFNNTKVSMMVNNVNKYLEGEYISCYYDCRNVVE